MNRRLRILLICQQDKGDPVHPIPAYRFWRSYFASSFAESGHTLLEVPLVDWALGLTQLPPDQHHHWQQESWSRTLDHLKSEHQRQPIDFVLSYLYPEQVLATAIDEIKSLGIPTVNFFCDNVREFRRVPTEFHPFDLHWVPEFKALSLYSKARLPTIHAPMPCWVAPQDRTVPSIDNGSAVFIGRRDDLRARLFAEAFSLGWNARIYGPGWIASNPPAQSHTSSLLRNQWTLIRRHGLISLWNKLKLKLIPPAPLEFDFGSHTTGESLSNQDYLHLSRDSAICIGVNRYPNPRRDPIQKPDTYSRLRDIEAPMVGACYLTEWTEGLELLYDPGTEIETYRDAAELVAKSEKLRATPGLRTSLRQAGQKRALHDHSINRTIERIAVQLDL